MTLFDVLWLCFMFAFGLTLGAWLIVEQGVCYGVSGFFLGVLAGAGLRYSLAVIIGILDPWETAMPICKNQVCRARDYLFLKVDSQGVHYRCRCGDEYVRFSNRCEEVLPDGSRRLYLWFSGSHGWEKELEPRATS